MAVFNDVRKPFIIAHTNLSGGLFPGGFCPFPSTHAAECTPQPIAKVHQRSHSVLQLCTVNEENVLCTLRKNMFCAIHS